MKFNEILRNLRKSNKKNIRQVVLETSIPYDSLARYERGESEPSIDVLITLADYYGVTLDYLLRGDANGIYISSEEYQELKCAKKAFDKLACCLNAIEHRQSMLENTTINANNNTGTIIVGNNNSIETKK